MEVVEDNSRNPTISKGIKVNYKNYFQIKYKTEEFRKKSAEILKTIIKKHEISDFHIQEQKAFLQSRIKYNGFTIIKDKVEFTIIDVEKEILKHYEYDIN